MKSLDNSAASAHFVINYICLGVTRKLYALAEYCETKNVQMLRVGNIDQGRHPSQDTSVLSTYSDVPGHVGMCLCESTKTVPRSSMCNTRLSLRSSMHNTPGHLATRSYGVTNSHSFVILILYGL